MIALYNLVVGIVVFGALRLAGRLRKDKVSAILLRRTGSQPPLCEHYLLVLKETELLGSDWGTHGEESYPEAAWLQLEVFALTSRPYLQ